jgi:hypothetical protein
MPVNAPVVLATVPTVVVLLLHVPPDGVAVSVVVIPEHSVGPPPIAPGRAFTVTVLVDEQPLSV